MKQLDILGTGLQTLLHRRYHIQLPKTIPLPILRTHLWFIVKLAVLFSLHSRNVTQQGDAAWCAMLNPVFVSKR